MFGDDEEEFDDGLEGAWEENDNDNEPGYDIYSISYRPPAQSAVADPPTEASTLAPAPTAAVRARAKKTRKPKPTGKQKHTRAVSKRKGKPTRKSVSKAKKGAKAGKQIKKR